MVLILILHYKYIDIDVVGDVGIDIDIIIYIGFVHDIDIDIGNDNAYDLCVRWGCLATLPPAL